MCHDDSKIISSRSNRYIQSDISDGSKQVGARILMRGGG